MVSFNTEGDTPTFAGHTVLAGAEEDEQGQLRADEALAGPRGRGQHQVGHCVGRGVHPPQAGAAQALTARDGLQALQPAHRGPSAHRETHVTHEETPTNTHTHTHTQKYLRYTCLGDKQTSHMLPRQTHTFQKLMRTKTHMVHTLMRQNHH